jgi:DNA-binding MarR family transcriptional regulator
VDPLIALPELIFEVAGLLELEGPTEAGLAELPASELDVLRLVTLFPGRGVAFLTERTKMRQANISATIRSLTGRGLVVKKPNEQDGRAVRLYASDKAMRDLEALRHIWLGRLSAALDAAGVTAAERAKLLADLEKVRDHLAQAGSAG